MKTRHLALAWTGLVIAACDSGSDLEPPDVNSAPAISAIADQNTTANQPSEPIGFSISDERPETVVISASSDHQAVIPDDSLVLAGNGEQRTLTVTPFIDTLGDAFISVTATDSRGASSSTSFLLTVVAQQYSMQQFTRENFAAVADGLPELVNAVEFEQDAEGDDFADLLAQ